MSCTYMKGEYMIVRHTNSDSYNNYIAYNIYSKQEVFLRSLLFQIFKKSYTVY
jgi:hypothetical protein